MALQNTFKLFRRNNTRESNDFKPEANLFIDDCQVEIKRWLALDSVLNTINSNKRTKLESLGSAAIALKSALEHIDSDIGAALYAQLITNLYCKPPTHDTEHLTFIAQKANINILALFDNELLEGVIGLVNNAALSCLQYIEVKTGVSNDREIALIANLAVCYKKRFNKAPAFSNGTIFRRFCTELGSIIGCSFGEATMKAALASFKNHSHYLEN